MGPQVWVGREGVVKRLPYARAPVIGRNDKLHLVAIPCGHPHNAFSVHSQQVLVAQSGIAQPKEELLRKRIDTIVSSGVLGKLRHLFREV